MLTINLINQTNVNRKLMNQLTPYFSDCQN